MRLVIDLQGAQSTGSSQRGIGRYSLALAEAMARQAGKHEVWVALNGAFPDTIEPLRAAFDSLLPQERIVIWETPTPVAQIDPTNTWRRRTGEILRESFLANLKPDMVHVSSLFEGLGDGAVTSAGGLVGTEKTAITLYDLIPLIHANIYLANPMVDGWYRRKLSSLRRVGLWLAISESSRREGIDWLDLPADKVVNVSTAAEARFRPLRLGDGETEALRRRYGLTRPFAMYTGGIDHRKNIEGLINAYALLPTEVRRAHQLAVVCSAEPESVSSIKQHAKDRGLDKDELVMTGFVSDDDLVKLYNICAGFCFPSKHEGFGLPALEAMQCGAPTIGSNLSSIPEVIGRADALFDPYDDKNMAARLHHLLTDADYRQTLTRHGLQQARKFTWQENARRAWDAFEAHCDERKTRGQVTFTTHADRPRLAYVSPLPPERSGIADYSAELLPELARHYDIDIIVNQEHVDDPWIKANLPIRSATWFDQNAQLFDRVLYHFGNSTFHQHMFYLLERHPGIVVLHDFYLSGIVAHMDIHDGRTSFLPSALYQSHGYHAVRERHHAKELSDIVRKYPANLAVLQSATGIIVHSEFSRHLARQFYGKAFPDDWAVIPLMRGLPQFVGPEAARVALGLDEHDFVLCSFGLLNPTKLNHRLLRAWLQSGLSDRPDCHLIFVGEGDGGDYDTEMRQMIDTSSAGKRIHITGYASPERYRQYLCAADAAVQLRTHSRGETSAAVFDCMGHGLPTVVNAHGSMAELPKGSVVMLPDAFTDEELTAAIEALHADPARWKVLGERARSYVKERLSPRLVADQYRAGIEDFYLHSREALRKRTLTALAAIDPAHCPEEDWLAVARAMNRNMPASGTQRQLLVDISELVRRDGGTCIPRVTRNVLRELLKNPPLGFRVEPVYATSDKRGYRYARNFVLRMLDCPGDRWGDDPIDLRQGDMFLGLDLHQQFLQKQAEFYAEMRRIGVGIYFVVYDLLPIRLPHAFPDEALELHNCWAGIVGLYADGVVCISRAVADDFANWLDGSGVERLRPLGIGWFHLGSDLDKFAHTRGLPDEAQDILTALSAHPSFLMVGTVEPRKGHDQTLAAFEKLWKAGHDVKIVIVGKQGWMVETLVDKLRHHPELGRRLFWLEGISDEYLEQVYAACDCLIAASEDEGFGLPLIEAARHKLPILARDIPVFREVAGEHASYFSGKEPDGLAWTVRDWLALYAKGQHTKSEGMPYLTWAESVERLKAILLQGGQLCSKKDCSSKQSLRGQAFRETASSAAGA